MNNRYLFVCMGNVDRSVAGENVFTGMLQEGGFSVGGFREVSGFDFYVGSAGLVVSNTNAFNGSTQLTREISSRAGKIFSVDEYVSFHLRKDYGVSTRRIIQLEVEDGRSLVIEEDARDLYAEFRRKLADYCPRKFNK